MNDKERVAKILNDAESALGSDFWAEYIGRIKAKLKAAIGNCTTKDDVRSHQGEVRAYKRVLSLPNDIIDDCKKVAK